MSGRAAGVLEEIATAVGRVEEARRPAAFRRRITTLQFQCWYLSLGANLREQLAPLSSPDVAAADRRLAKPR